MNILEHRAYAATAAIDNAKTPMQKLAARREGLAAKSDLEKQLADQKALAAFKATKPQNSAGVWNSEQPVSNRKIHMVGPAGTKIVGPVALSDGSRSAAPNPAGQISVEPQHVADLVARGFERANDAALTDVTGNAEENGKDAARAR